MAYTHGKDAYFALDNTASVQVLTDISDYTDTADLNRSIETGETTTFGDDNKTYIVGLADATTSLGGKWHEDLDVLIGTSEPASRSWEFGPLGSDLRRRQVQR